MKRIVVTAGMAAAVGLSAVSIADPNPDAAPVPYGDLAESLALDDVWVDAERVFAKVDVDRSGEIDVDEYAAQAVVYAGLVRFNGVVAIDGRELIHVGLPTEASATMGTAERAAIDAVARDDYYRIAAEGAITPTRWIAMRMAAFDAADRNGDGQLTGRELQRYAMGLAQYAQSEDRWI